MEQNRNLDQRTILNIYLNQYNQTFRQINYLYGQLESIRSNINNIIQSNNIVQPNNIMNQTRRNNRFVFYDYNNPIHPNTYLQEHNNSRPNFMDLVNSFLNTNVTVRPTEEQINNASEIVSYDTIENPQNDCCPISLDSFQPNEMVRKIHHCGHIFNQISFNSWFQRSVRCPVCRYDIREYSSATNSSQSNDRTTNSSQSNDRITTNSSQSNDRITTNSSQSNDDILDDTDIEISNQFLHTLTNRIFENLFTNSQNYYDASSNIIVYERFL
jgi:hypothetical protein